jgi:hypothetical protein
MSIGAVQEPGTAHCLVFTSQFAPVRFLARVGHLVGVTGICLMDLEFAIAEALNQGDLKEVERLRREWRYQWRWAEASSRV